MFSRSSPFIKAVLKFVDLLVLNAMWLIGCAPIITIGISTVACLDVMRRDILSDEGMVATDFVRAIRENAKQSFIAGLVYSLICGVLIVDIVMLKTLLASGSKVGNLWVIPLLLLIFATVLFFWVCAHIAFYNQTLKVIVKNCGILSIMHFPVSLVIVVVVALCAAGVWVYPGTLFLLPVIGLLLIAYLLRRAFLQHSLEDQDESEKENS